MAGTLLPADSTRVAHRGFYTINNNLSDNAGAFTRQQSFAALAKFTAGSNNLSPHTS